MKIRSEITLPATPAQVAAILNSADDAPLWQAGLLKMETVSGGPDRAGAVALLHYVEGDRSYVMEDELLQCEPGKHWRSRVSGNGMTILVDTVLEDAGGETQLRISWDGRPDAVWARLPFYFARGVIKKQMEADLDSLARLAAARAQGDARPRGDAQG